MELDDDIRERILRGAAELRADNKLLSREALARAYATFRQRFGPEALAQLDGDALLTYIHDHGQRDSLVYWLEFKGDDEFPSVFGSIAGGSALKFGIYRRKETGAWMTGHPSDQRVLEVPDAIAIARRNRDQLVAGARILLALPAEPTKVDYDALQASMIAAAPDVAETAWGHKYFSLIAPEILDDYHAPAYQRFHVLKVRLQPALEGRYRGAAVLARLARTLDLLPNQLDTILNHLDGDPHRWIRLGTTAGDGGESFWRAMLLGGYAGVGWNRAGDLTGLVNDKGSRDEIKRRLADTSKTPGSIGNAASQLFDLACKTGQRDVIVAMNGAKRVLGVGRVTGDYFFVPGEAGFAHRRPVEWLSDREWDLPQPEPVPATYRNLRHDPNIVAVERERWKPAARANRAPAPVSVVAAPVPPALTGIVGRIEGALRRKSQVILYGPPGTGKTHHAEEASQELASRSFFGKSWSDLSDTDKHGLRDPGPGGLGAIETCCFHPAFGYEDFLEGYRPTAEQGGLSFARRDGVFKRLCLRAANEPERQYFLLIDEINRGDVPRIFGELLTVLERSRRGRPITLPVSGDTFVVPANVFVIATMNTADRSIALLDAALRRRFAFIELMPQGEAIGTANVRGVPLGPWLDSLNARVRKHVGRDARNLQVGHTYLLDGGVPVRDFAKLRAALRDEIFPLLEEYCYDRPDALVEVVGDALYDPERRRFRDELLDGSNDEGLVQALLKPDPGIVTTRAAIDAGELEDDSEPPDPADP